MWRSGVFWNSLSKSLIAVGLPENGRKDSEDSEHGKLQEFYWKREERDEAIADRYLEPERDSN